MPESEKAPHPKTRFRVGRLKFFVFLTKKVIWQCNLLLQAVLPFSLSTAASSRLTTKQALKKYRVKLSLCVRS